MIDPDNASELEKNFPHIVEKMVMLWSHEGVGAFLSHLLIDDRGDRKGFTGDIMSELMFLNTVHEEMVSNKAAQSGQAIWANPLTKNLHS